jgi:hypothetical protein
MARLPVKRVPIKCGNCQGTGRSYEMRSQTRGIPWGMHGRVSSYRDGPCPRCEGTGKAVRLVWPTVIARVPDEQGNLTFVTIDNPEYDKF